MKHTIILSAFFLFAFLSLDAQESSTTIKYQDGSTFIGKVIAETETELTMVLSSNDTLRVNKDFIDKRRRIPNNALVFNKNKFHYTDTWFWNIGLGFGLSHSPTSQIDIGFGKRLNKDWAVGVGLGLHTYQPGFTWDIIDGYLTPYVHGRYYLSDSRVRFFVDARLGYGLEARMNNIVWGWGITNREQLDGLSGGLGVGLNFASKKNVRYLIGIFQNVQHARGSYTQNRFDNLPTDVNYNLWYNRPVLRFTMEIK